MLKYYNPFTLDNGYVLSCDGVRIKFQINDFGINLQEFSKRFFDNLRPDIENYPISIKPNSYKHMCTVTYGDNATITIGFFFNGSKRITENGYDNNYLGMIDFNLNKVGEYRQFWEDYGYIKSCCSHFECMRVDIALDIPVNRENILLEKDKRKYSCDIYSKKNKTEYLGRRSNIGFVKVYNKQIESDLDYPLTRIETTCELNVDSLLSHFPKVYNIDNKEQVEMSIMDLETTNKVILEMENQLLINGLDLGLTTFNSLSKYIKQKLKPFLLPESSAIGLFCFGLNNLTNFMESLEDSLRV